ncbi:MAG: D-glycero-beta-D-manno-heptose-7-phosphate kinase [Myxococcota bacterium]
MPDNVSQIPNGERRPTLMVLGDVILDEYLRGTAERISPEAPVPILQSIGSEDFPGGAANVAANLVALGCGVRLFGVVGNDEHGKRLVALLDERSIGASGISVDATRPTTHKLRVLAQSRQVVRIDREAHHDIDDATVASAIAYVRRHIGEVTGIICSDYRKGTLTPALLKEVVELARQAGIPVTVDPKGADYGRYRGVDVITPNLEELHVATGVGIADPAERDRAVRLLLEETQARAVLVTCGKDGMVLCERQGEITPIAAAAREVFDVTGAGDTVAAVFGLAVANGTSLLEAARLANRAAGVVVGKVGTATVVPSELAGGRDGLPGRKVVSLDTAVEEARRGRASNRKVVFTNGCFDLLHAGHVDYLETARRCGDMLVVGVNDDASVRTLKGSTRPVNIAVDRARVVAGLGCVDLVVIFSEETPADLVAALRPDVLVKGTDYKPEEVAGRQSVEENGGRLELIPIRYGQSTTDLFAKIARAYLKL